MEKIIVLRAKTKKVIKYCELGAVNAIKIKLKNLKLVCEMLK